MTANQGVLSPTLGPTDPYAEAHIYYGGQDTTVGRSVHRTRTLSSVLPALRQFQLIHQAGLSGDYQNQNTQRQKPETGRLRRRASHGVDVTGALPRKFVIDVEETLNALLSSEDTDDNKQITIEDVGPKILRLGTARSNGILKFGISGTYMLSNLLQELTLAKDYGRERIILDEARLNENPVARLSRLIRKSFWDRLTRRIDAVGLELIAADPKNRTRNQQPRIYIPHGEQEQYDYYVQTAKERPHLNLIVDWLPEKITPEWVKSVNDKPGLLALAMERVVDSTGRTTLKGYPFVVPGGRFNEMYGWDSYFESLGLLVDGKVELARGMVENFIFEINHYGKILNANRSYYLCRSQPPFLTDMALQVYERIKHEPDSLDFIRRAITAAIYEYRTVWTLRDGPRRDPITGLTRYRPDGLGIPPETEASHFHHLLQPYADKYGMTFEEFQVAYNDGKVHEPELDTYFMHDRAVRESGHDTTYRFEGVCADLATVDLNTILYKYETDISATIRKLFNDSLMLPGQKEPETSSAWDRRAQRRKKLIDKYLWNEEKGMYFDYNCLSKEQTTYESATTFWALWSGVASPLQAAKMVEKALPKFTFVGGLVAGTEASRGNVSLDAPNRQWDYPTGWAPHQILAWYGLRRYGYEEEAKNLCYRWLFTILKSFVDFNGVVVEKYNVTHNNPAHRVDAEYGNQGSDFEGVAREGFGWVNASFQVGINDFCDVAMKRALGTCSPPHVFFARRAEFEVDPDGTASPGYDF